MSFKRSFFLFLVLLLGAVVCAGQTTYQTTSSLTYNGTAEQDWFFNTGGVIDAGATVTISLGLTTNGTNDNRSTLVCFNGTTTTLVANMGNAFSGGPVDITSCMAGFNPSSLAGAYICTSDALTPSGCTGWSTFGNTGTTFSSMSITVTTVAPVLSKAFGAATVPLNGTTSLTLSILNLNAASSFTGLAFTDNLPAGLVVATPSGLTNTCGGTATATAGSSAVSLSGGGLGIAAPCSVIVNVKATTLGTKVNVTGAVSANESGAGNTANATVTVLSVPTLTESFGVSPLSLNHTTSLTFTITNPNTSALTGLAFTDSLPAGLLVAIPNGLTNTCGGTATAITASSSVSLSGGSLGASASCTLILNVTGTTAGAKVNTTGALSSNEAGTGNTANATLTVAAAPAATPALSTGMLLLLLASLTLIGMRRLRREGSLS